MTNITIDNIRSVVFDPLLTPFTEQEQAELRAIKEDKNFYIAYQRLLKKYRQPEPKRRFGNLRNNY